MQARTRKSVKADFATRSTIYWRHLASNDKQSATLLTLTSAM